MNSLNGLIPILYSALQTVSREMVGLIPAVMRDMTADAAAKGQTITVPITPPSDTQDIVPGTPPGNTGTDFDHIDLTISKMKMAKPIVWTGDEQISVGGQLNGMLINQYAQAMRSLVNEIEADLAIEGVGGALSVGNVLGTAGTTPFSSSLSELAQIIRVLNEHGAPVDSRQFVASTAAAAALRSLTNLTHVSNNGNEDMLRRGVFNELLGFMARESAGYKLFSPGTTSTKYLLNGIGKKGATELVIDTGVGAINKGAIITIAGDTTQYVVAEALASGGTKLKIAKGLIKDIADNAAITLGAAYQPSLGFTSDALLLATRLPSMPQGGDDARDVTVISDPVSGLAFQAALYGAYRQNRVEIGLAWGTRSINPAHSVVLLG
jgi:hypothetical protein